MEAVVRLLACLHLVQAITPPRVHDNAVGYSRIVVATPGLRTYTYDIAHDRSGSDFNIHYSPLDTELDSDNFLPQPEERFIPHAVSDYDIPANEDDQITLNVKHPTHEEMEKSSKEIQGVHEAYSKKPPQPQHDDMLEDFDLGIMGYGDFMDPSEEPRNEEFPPADYDPAPQPPRPLRPDNGLENPSYVVAHTNEPQEPAYDARPEMPYIPKKLFFPKPQRGLAHYSIPPKGQAHYSSPPEGLAHYSSPPEGLANYFSPQKESPYSSPQKGLVHYSNPQKEPAHYSSPHKELTRFPSPQKGIGHLSSPQKGLGHLFSSQKGLGHFSSPQEGLGHFSSPQKGVGHFSSPQKGLGHFSSPQKGLGHFSSPQKGLRHFSSPQKGLVEKVEVPQVHYAPPFNFERALFIPALNEKLSDMADKAYSKVFMAHGFSKPLPRFYPRNEKDDEGIDVAKTLFVPVVIVPSSQKSLAEKQNIDRATSVDFESRKIIKKGA